MSEPDKPCKWTTASLFEHFTALREADEKAESAAHRAMEARLQGMNEWRQTVDGILSEAVSRREAWAFVAGLLGLVIAAIGFLR